LSFSVGTTLDEIERTAIRETLTFTKGDKRLAAQLLGIATRTIYRKLDRSDVAGEFRDGDADPEHELDSSDPDAGPEQGD
jgi:two-component system response regulator HydG